MVDLCPHRYHPPPLIDWEHSVAVDDFCKHVGVLAQCLLVDVSSLSCNTSYVDYQEEWFMVVPAIHEGFSHVTTMAEYHTLFDARECQRVCGCVVFDIYFSSSVIDTI